MTMLVSTPKALVEEEWGRTGAEVARVFAQTCPEAVWKNAVRLGIIHALAAIYDRRINHLWRLLKHPEYSTGRRPRNPVEAGVRLDRFYHLVEYAYNTHASPQTAVTVYTILLSILDEESKRAFTLDMCFMSPEFVEVMTRVAPRSFFQGDDPFAVSAALVLCIGVGSGETSHTDTDKVVRVVRCLLTSGNRNLLGPLLTAVMSSDPSHYLLTQLLELPEAAGVTQAEWRAVLSVYAHMDNMNAFIAVLSKPYATLPLSYITHPTIRPFAIVRFKRIIRALGRIRLCARRYREDFYNPDHPGGFMDQTKPLYSSIMRKQLEPDFAVQDEQEHAH